MIKTPKKWELKSLSTYFSGVYKLLHAKFIFRPNVKLNKLNFGW